jgi:anti-sigma factor RsiW
MITPRMISDAELCAFLDGELPAQRAAEIAAVIKFNPEMLAKLNTWRAQNQWLRASFAALAQEPVPDMLTHAMPTERTPPFPHEVLTPAPPVVARDDVLFWKKVALILGTLLFATSLYASGLVPHTGASAPSIIHKWMDQPRSLRGS